VWGLNDAGDHHKENSVLAETNVQLNKWGVYGRYEWVQKSVHELGMTWLGELRRGQFPVSMFSVGLNRQIASFGITILQAGGQVSLYKIDRVLEASYGKTPLSGQVYLRITPGLMRM
jgi:hypothetical protein